MYMNGFAPKWDPTFDTDATMKVKFTTDCNQLHVAFDLPNNTISKCAAACWYVIMHAYVQICWRIWSEQHSVQAYFLHCSH